MRALLSSLLRDSSVRWRIAAFALAGVLALGVGFRWVPPEMAERGIVLGGYHYILAVFGLAAWFAGRVLLARRGLWASGKGEWRKTLLVLAAALVFAVWSDSFQHKVLFDEYVLQGTAWHMHLTKEVGTPVRAYDIAGTWVGLDPFLDKRPYFFAFLLSLVHDLAGYRLENIFALNVVLAFVCLGLTHWITMALTGRRGCAWLTVALLATLPLFGQNATGAGMEMHNLTMIAVVMAAGILYLRAPDGDRLSLFVLSTVLLAQSRYESVLFVAPVAVLIILGWLRRGRVLLPWPALIAPLLLVPYAWHSRVVDAKPVLWQLREGDEARFAWRYLAGNLEGAFNFFTSVSPGQPASLILTLLGLGGLGLAGWRLLRRWRAYREGRPELPAAPIVVALMGMGVMANLGLLMFYYWSRLDEPIAARFALPAYLLLAVAAGWLAHATESPRVPALRLAFAGLAAWLLIFAVPAYARRLYTVQNLVMQEIEWEVEQMRRREGPVLVITSKATMPYLLHRMSAINIPVARTRMERIAWHMREGTFKEVLVAQVLRPTSAEGEAAVDGGDALPPEFRLEPVETKRFGMRWIRISRVLAAEVAEGAAGAAR